MLKPRSVEWVRLIAEGHSTEEEIELKQLCFSVLFPLDIFLKNQLEGFKTVPEAELHPTVAYFYKEEVEKDVLENWEEALEIMAEAFGYYAVEEETRCLS